MGAFDSGLTDTAVCALAVSGTALFAGTSNGGIFRSVNNGSTWGRVVNDSIYPPVKSFLVKGANLFALRRYPPRGRPKILAIEGDLVLDTVVALEGIYLCTDDGISWTYTSPDSISVNCLLAAGENLIAGTDGHGVLLSSNNGETWEAKNEGLTDSSIASLALSGSEFFAGTYGHGC